MTSLQNILIVIIKEAGKERTKWFFWLSFLRTLPAVKGNFSIDIECEVMKCTKHKQLPKQTLYCPKHIKMRNSSRTHDLTQETDMQPGHSGSSGKYRNTRWSKPEYRGAEMSPSYNTEELVMGGKIHLTLHSNMKLPITSLLKPTCILILT